MRLLEAQVVTAAASKQTHRMGQVLHKVRARPLEEESSSKLINAKLSAVLRGTGEHSSGAEAVFFTSFLTMSVEPGGELWTQRRSSLLPDLPG